MRLRAPRIGPLDPASLSEEQAGAVASVTREGAAPLNIFLTFARAPEALRRFLEWGGYVLSRRNSLDPRRREIAILRTGYLCGSGYEFGQHERIGLAAGMTEAEVAATKEGAGAECWDDIDRAIVRACDELVGDHFVSDATWAALEPLGDKGRMDVVFTVGQYTQVSMMLNSFGVQLEDGDRLDPDLDRR
ncbi:carboxymuconolactone decarboxylase family protein [Tsuneonella amylolytica]|uniref:carboxymuconolactone decarboxylase family protein n=1 Tax=Tsuneonella amylolytica TaxID=2338327 RepID=UPI000EA92A12|nr:carboxymuconolactone decarboxylase family protein [Tsuneonella amylolytica]